MAAVSETPKVFPKRLAKACPRVCLVQHCPWRGRRGLVAQEVRLASDAAARRESAFTDAAGAGERRIVAYPVFRTWFAGCAARGCGWGGSAPKGVRRAWGGGECAVPGVGRPGAVHRRRATPGEAPPAPERRHREPAAFSLLRDKYSRSSEKVAGRRIQATGPRPTDPGGRVSGDGSRPAGPGHRTQAESSAPTDSVRRASGRSERWPARRRAQRRCEGTKKAPES